MVNIQQYFYQHIYPNIDVEKLGGKLEQIPSLINGKYTIEIKHYPNTTLFFIANPNNPVGKTSVEDIINLANLNPHAILCLDEAYSQFSALSLIDQINNFSNIVVLRSFSKDYGMAGNRIGYIAAPAEIIEKVDGYLEASWWCRTSYLSSGAAISALKHEEYFKGLINEILITKQTFEEFLINKQFKVLKSYINSTLISFDSIANGNKFYDYLKSKDILVSHSNGESNIGLDERFIRIAIGTQKQMKELQDVINNYIP